jgi:hypothetical protein
MKNERAQPENAEDDDLRLMIGSILVSGLPTNDK